MKGLSHYLSLFCYLLIITNLIYIDLLIISNNSDHEGFNTFLVAQQVSLPASTVKSDTETSSVVCDASCISEIYASIEKSTKSAAPVLKSDESSVNVKNNSRVKELFIPFGSGSSSADDWSDVPGMVATIDSLNYSGIKSIVFEATLRIPTGNQKLYARLYNVTDKHPVWFSEVSIEGGTPQLVTSQPIMFDSGSKIYQVQLKTSLKYQSFIDQARIRITLQ